MIDNKYQIVLLGDIGGTNSRFQLYNITNNEVIKDQTYETQHIESFQNQIQIFLKNIDKLQYPLQAHIGIAGPVIGNQVLISNAQQLGNLDGNKLQKILNLEKFIFYNDFEIASYAVLYKSQNNFLQINTPIKPIKNSIISIIGPGTGLGRSIIVPQIIINNKNEFVKYKVFPSEGGSVAFSAITDEQFEYYKYVKEQRQESQVILEHASTGLSIPYMYKFYRSKLQNSQKLQLQLDIGNEFQESLLLQGKYNKQIFKYGLEQKCSICQKVLQLFVEILEIIVGNIIMETLCYGGLYIIGNIAYSLAQYLQNPDNKFLQKYKENRKAMEQVFDKVPIYIMGKQEEMGLKGAQVAAQQYNACIINQ